MGLRRYFVPWPGVRSGRAPISHTCSSAAKPWPKRISGGSAAWPGKIPTASDASRPPSTSRLVIPLVSFLGRTTADGCTISRPGQDSQTPHPTQTRAPEPGGKACAPSARRPMLVGTGATPTMPTLDLQHIKGLVQADRVHRSVYTDPALFELELERLFGR